MEKQQSIKNLMIPIFTFILGIGLITGCSNKKSNSSDEMGSDSMAMSESSSSMNQTQAYTATLKGESEVPAVTTDATGKVTVTLMSGGKIQVKGQFSGLSSEYTASHIHMGAKGEDGDVVQPLDPTINDDNMSGSFNSSYTLDDSLVTALKGGQLYVNVHSEDHKGGEIRGQLSSSDMSGMNDSDSMDMDQ